MSNQYTQNQYPTQGQSSEQLQAVDRLAYTLFALVLGNFGVHKFYAGHTGKGILFLIFFWTGIPGIVAFCTFIKGLLTVPDSRGQLYLTDSTKIVDTPYGA